MNKPGGAKSSPDMNLTIHYLDAAPDRSGLASGEIVACEEEWSAGAKIQNVLRERYESEEMQNNDPSKDDTDSKHFLIKKSHRQCKAQAV